MSIRVSSNQMVYGYQKQLNDANTRQTKLLEQGDGSKLHRPSDNSVDYSKYLRYSVSEGENLQYQDNVSSALSWMKTSDAALVNMTSIQTTFKEKTVAAANSTNNESDMVAIAKEMMAKIQELVSLGNTMQGDSYVFGGQSGLTKPFIMSTEKVARALAKTLDENQSAFFSGEGAVDDTGSMHQMLTLKGSDNNTYYLNTKNGRVYTKEFVENGYKDVVAKESRKQVAAGDEIGTHGDDKGISMVKKNGSTEPVADTVNVTGPEIFGTDIFDDASSGNKASGAAMLNQMLTVRAQVEKANHKWLAKDGQTVADAVHSTTVNTETKLGARQQLYGSVKTMLDNQNEIIMGDITEVSSTDVAKLAVQLMQEQTIYNMSLSLGGRILPQSLADYLR